MVSKWPDAKWATNYIGHPDLPPIRVFFEELGMRMARRSERHRELPITGQRRQSSMRLRMRWHAIDSIPLWPEDIFEAYRYVPR